MKALPLRQWPNILRSKILPFENSRVVAPAGKIGCDHRRCIVVATTMRACAHVMIDLLLNNLPAYRFRPLYVNRDRYLRRAEASGNLQDPLRMPDT